MCVVSIYKTLLGERRFVHNTYQLLPARPNTQVFIPTVPVSAYTPTHHVDILCSLGPMPSAAEWEEKGLDKYGLIAVNASGEAAQVGRA